MNTTDDMVPDNRFPLDDDDKAEIEQIVILIRSELSTMTSGDIKSAATVIHALERLPETTPGVSVVFTFSQPDIPENRMGSYGWVDIQISEEEFSLNHGEQFFSPAGGDTETRTIFETQAGTDWREGNIYDWLPIARIIGREGCIYCEDESD